jgi:hypothetical protein
MREWNLESGDPLSLIIAADARLGATDYLNDHIWELSLGGGDPAALAVHTTFGLRARAFRMFPRFSIQDNTSTDPSTFPNPPVIRHFYPNFLEIQSSPFHDIDVRSEYWVPDSHRIAGRISVENRASDPCQISIEWIALLTPNEGERMSLEEIQAGPVLTGKTGDLQPVVFMTGGPTPGSGPYPSLSVRLDIPAGGSQLITWAEAAHADRQDSYESARQLAARKWDAERARLELLNASLLEIYTGNADWDAAFALSQKVAYSLIMGPTQELPHPSLVQTRQPDQGYSMRGDGSDYNYLWNGQTPLDAYYLCGQILPSFPELAEGILTNFLSTQDPDGTIDWKPGLGGQRSGLAATPLLASMAWKIYQVTEDDGFLKEVFAGLLQHTFGWFSSTQDRDGDGIPEWDHPMQAGMEDHPLFSPLYEWSKGVDIRTSESAALCALLYGECNSLIRMAEVLEYRESIPTLRTLLDTLREAVEASWDASDASYHNWDRDTHESIHGELLGERLGPGDIPIQREFKKPVRLLVRIRTSGETTRRPNGFIYGTSATGHNRIEHISPQDFHWYLGNGSLTGDRVYSKIDRLELQGLDPDDHISLFSVDYHFQDLTLMLPLWAGIPNPDHAAKLVKRTLTNPNKYWHNFGMPLCPRLPHENDATPCINAPLLWNSIVGKGLTDYGYRAESAELVSRLMAAVIASLKKDHCFRRHYHSGNGEGSGDRHILSGLAPLSLFLETLGVRLISNQKVALAGKNPFPWPVTVKYRGLTVMRQKEKSMVIFPDGQTVVVEDPEPRIISLESEGVLS